MNWIYLETSIGKYIQMLIKITAVSVIMAFISAFLNGCSFEQDSASDIQRLYGIETICDTAGTVYFGGNDTLYRWVESENKTEIAAKDFFYPDEERRMAALNGKVYTVRWDTGMLTVLDPKTGKTEELTQVFDWIEDGGFCGDIWVYDGQICNVGQNAFSDKAEIRIWSADGQLTQTISLSVERVFPLFACQEYFFYLKSGIMGPGYAVNLQTGEETYLGIYRPYTITDGKLAVIEQGVYDENGEYHWKGEGDIYLMDRHGNLTAYPPLEDGVWIEIGRYFGKDGTVYRYDKGKTKPLLDFGKHTPPAKVWLNDFLHMQTTASFEMLSENITLLDATGENAEAVEKANQTRIFENDGDSLTLALSPDDTLYLLNRS